MREIVGELADEGPTEAEVERARSYAAGRRVLAFESTIAVARAARHRGSRSSAARWTRTRLIAALDRVTYDDVCQVARAVGGEPAVACVGPHEVGDFTLACNPDGRAIRVDALLNLRR